MYISFQSIEKKGLFNILMLNTSFYFLERERERERENL